jgi:hypothetical protein
MYKKAFPRGKAFILDAVRHLFLNSLMNDTLLFFLDSSAA